jgi:hypothetical protein
MSSKAKRTRKRASVQTGRATAKTKAPRPTQTVGWAEQMIESLTEAQKRWPDFASRQSRQFIETMREGPGLNVSNMTRTVSDFAGQGIRAIVKARIQWLDFVDRQNARTLKTLRDNLGLDENSSATALADFAQQAVTNYVEVQKRWLNLTTQLLFTRQAEKK